MVWQHVPIQRNKCVTAEINKYRTGHKACTSRQEKYEPESNK